ILYQQRNRFERFFNKLKHVRAVATRYDKSDDNFLASVQLAALRIWLRTYEVGDLDCDHQGRVCRCRGMWR
ncbi:hypothetical protein O4J55_01345, partial [Paracoccus sp. PXZ]